MTRKTKTIANQSTVLTYPANTLDPDVSLERALDARRPYNRMNDVSAMTSAATTLAAEVLFPSIGKLAFMARGRDPWEPLQSSAGWQASCLLTRSETTIDLLIRHPEKPGGFLLNVSFTPAMTDFGKRSHEALQAEKDATRAARGATTLNDMLDEVLGKDVAWNAFMANPMVWRAAQEDDRVNRISGTMLDMGAPGPQGPGGISPQIDRNNTAQVGPFTALEAHPKSWWRGIAFEISPQLLSGPDDYPEISTRGRSGLIGDLLLLEIIGDMARHNGFGDAIKDRLDQLAVREWTTFGDERDACLAEAGLSAVHAAGGVIDASVIERIARFSVAIAGQDLERQLPELDVLGAALLREGHVDGDTSYDCNDMRDLGHAVEIEGGVSMRTRTQNGRYRLDLTEDGVHAFRQTGAQDHLIASFSRHDDALTVSKMPESHNARDVRDLNGIIQSFQSMACCLAEDLERTAADTPSP